MTKSYSLRLTYHPSGMPGMQPQYKMTCVPSPTHPTEGGAMQAAYYPSWEDLFTLLDSVRVDKDELARAKIALDQFRSHLLSEMMLEDYEVERLGFDPAKCK